MTRDRETRRAHPPDFDADDDDAFDVPGAPSALDAFVAEGWISEVLHEVKSGKEAVRLARQIPDDRLSACLLYMGRPLA